MACPHCGLSGACPPGTCFVRDIKLIQGEKLVVSREDADGRPLGTDEIEVPLFLHYYPLEEA